MPVKILEDENCLHRHRLHVGQRLHGITAVVHRRARRRARINHHRRRQRPRKPVCFSPARTQHGSRLTCRCRPTHRLINAGLNPETRALQRRRRSGSRTGSHQPIRDRPLERSHVKLRAGGAHEINRAHLLRRLHHDDRSRRVYQYLQAFQSIRQKLFLRELQGGCEGHLFDPSRDAPI